MGANALRNFDSRLQSSAGSWTDTLAALQLTNAGAAVPAYAADAGFARNIPCHQCDVATAKCLAKLVPAPTIWAAGSRPYIYGVARFRAYPAAFNILMKVANAPVTANAMIFLTSAGTTMNASSYAITAAAAFNDTTRLHAFEMWIDAGNVMRFALDGILVASSAAGAALADASGFLSLGGNQLATANLTDTNHWRWVFAQRLPNPTIRKRLLWGSRKAYLF